MIGVAAAPRKELLLGVVPSVQRGGVAGDRAAVVGRRGEGDDDLGVAGRDRGRRRLGGCAALGAADADAGEAAPVPMLFVAVTVHV